MACDVHGRGNVVGRIARGAGRIRRATTLRLELLETRVVPATITVNTAADDPTMVLDSLRAAIDSIDHASDTNPSITAARTGLYGSDDTIAFDIAGSGVQTIGVATALPTITVPLTIDGYSQPGASVNTSTQGTNAHLLIELDGSAAGGADALTITSSHAVIRGLVIHGFGGSGVNLSGAGSTNNRVEGNFIGTDATGTVALRNLYGVSIQGGASLNTVGGATPSARNLLSANYAGVRIQGVGTSANVVEGNSIGNDAAGSTRLLNNNGVIISGGATGNLIGGATAGAGNLISGNDNAGVWIEDPGTSANVVAGNTIGANAAGNGVLGNGVGVFIVNKATGNTVGGTTAGAGNSIVDSTYGVLIQNPGTIGNRVEGNSIGPDQGSDASLANGTGVAILEGASENTVGGTDPGAGNIITQNVRGVVVGLNLSDVGAVDNSILGNRIYGNSSIGIDLGFDGPTPNGVNLRPFPNHGQNYPLISSGVGTTVSGLLVSAPSTSYRVEFFASSASSPAQGQTFLGFVNVTTDRTGIASIEATLSRGVPTGMVLTSTATDLTTHDTSEFSTATTPAVVVSPVALPAMTVGSAFGVTEQASGGVGGPYTFTITAGALPAGLTLDGETGVIEGIPSQAGAYAFSVTATDPANGSGTQSYGGLVNHAAVTLTPNSLPALTVGRFLKVTEQASGGVGGPYTFAITAGALPAGLTLDGRTGVIEGTPSVSGPYGFTLAAISADGERGAHRYLGMVRPAVTPPAVDLTVVRLQRFGYHNQPTVLVLSFNAALDPLHARDPGNYALFVVAANGRRLRPVPLRAPVYDPAHLSVSLAPRARSLALRQTYVLEVNGKAPVGLSSLSGAFLDGRGGGHPGTDFTTRFGPEILAGPNHTASLRSRRTVTHRG